VSIGHPLAPTVTHLASSYFLANAAMPNEKYTVQYMKQVAHVYAQGQGGMNAFTEIELWRRARMVSRVLR
jgi:hypothetical protein